MNEKLIRFFQILLIFNRRILIFLFFLSFYAHGIELKKEMPPFDNEHFVSGSISGMGIPIKVWKYLDQRALETPNSIEGLSKSKWELLINEITDFNFLDSDYWTASKGAVLWLKVQIPESIKLKDIWIELLPNVGMTGELFISSGEGWKIYDSVIPFSAENGFLPAQNLLFKVDSIPQSKTLYLRIVSGQSFHFKVQAFTLEQISWSFLFSNVFFGFLAGMLILAISYNLAIGILSKESIYIFYSLYVLANLSYVLDVTGYDRLFFSDFTSSHVFTKVNVILVGLSSVLFVRKFLDTKKLQPINDKVLIGFIYISILTLALLRFIPEYYQFLIVLGCGLVCPYLVLITGIISRSQHHPMSLFFLVSWTIFLISAVYWGWMWLGILDPSEWIVNFYLCGILVEVLLLSLALGLRFNNLKEQTKLLNLESSRFKHLSETDHLTQVLNRRGFLRQVEKQLSSSKNGGIVWLALDVDNFKNFNDTYGHPTGDKLLCGLGELLNNIGRKNDIIGRIGGEEFAIVLVDCSLDSAHSICNRIIEEVAKLSVLNSDNIKVGTTMSIGATEILPGDSLDSVWKRADSFLYKAKKFGRNQSVFA